MARTGRWGLTVTFVGFGMYTSEEEAEGEEENPETRTKAGRIRLSQT